MHLQSNLFQNSTATVNKVEETTSFKDQYFSLLNSNDSEHLKESSIRFLAAQLLQTRAASEQYPTEEKGLLNWLDANTVMVGKQYQEYLQGRKNGEPRRYFSNKSHALFFLKSIAPTKMVDGAWLHGFTRYHTQNRCFSLIKTYLEELGEGHSEKNHVSIYSKLLRKYGLDLSDELDDKYYQQGAIQLALGQLTEYFMPEIIGFNLGYEQLPLHLLITAYELKELGIDPYYFTLHITIDNACTGHARAAVQSVLENAPLLADKEDYFSRVFRGLQLNNLGMGTEAIIAHFDIEQEFISIVRKKANIGQYMHSNHCQIEGHSINEWLSDSEKTPQFIKALESNGWILRNQNPMKSRFWKLIDNDRAMMFGVFNAYEKQVIYEWIAGTFLNKDISVFNLPITDIHNPGSEDESRDSSPIEIKSPLQSATNIVYLPSNTKTAQFHPNLINDWEKDEVLFETKINSCTNETELMNLFSNWMTPARHHGKIGLKATQLYKEQIYNSENQLD